MLPTIIITLCGVAKQVDGIGNSQRGVSTREETVGGTKFFVICSLHELLIKTMTKYSNFSLSVEGDGSVQSLASIIVNDSC